MTIKKLLILLIAGLFFNLAACRKNFSEEKYTEPEIPVQPDLGVKITATVAGFITDENKNPVSGAEIKAGNKQGLTDEYGYFKLSNVVLSKTAGFIKISKKGYFEAFKTFTAKEGKETFLRSLLFEKKETGNFAAASGGTATTASGAKVTLPANAVVTAANGNAYTGQVHISARLIDLASTEEQELSAVSDGRGINREGNLRALKNYSSIMVELNGAAGEKLQIATGSKATLTLPIAPALMATAPAQIALWSYDESNGLWKEEGTAVKTGNAYVGTVGHFSFWEGAVGMALVNFTAQVLNSNLQPLANVPVVVSYANQPANSGHSRFGFTDANGNVSGAIPANSSLVLEVMTTCAIPAYAHPFSTGSSNLDLGVLTGNMGQGLVTITGTVNNCSGPVTNGYVQTYDHGFYNRIPVNNGSFSFTGLACVNTSINYVAVDNVTHQQNTPQTITLATGTNNLGVLTACGTSTIGNITYSIDGVTRTLIEPADTLAAYGFPPNPYTTIINLKTGSNSPTMSLQFDGGMTLGNGHKISDIWSEGYASGRALAPVPLTVTITEYGDIGGFISGSFSGQVLDFVSNTPHMVNYSFRIKRFN